jgi:sugar/nucleoside kinase (ribokinase family)
MRHSTYDTFLDVLDLVTAGDGFDDFIFHGLLRLPIAGEEIKTAQFSRTPGGGAVITAIAASRLGLRCAVISAVSPEVVRALRRERVAVTNLKRPGEDAAISVAMSTAHDRAFVTFNGVNDRLPDRLSAAIRPVRARHVHLAFQPKACRSWIGIVERLRSTGTTTSWDFGWNPALPRDRDFRTLATAVDYLFVNRDEAMLYVNARNLNGALDRWIRTPGTVVVKLGRDGSRAIGGGAEIRAAADRVRVVDTTGAGDAFNAGFLAARLRGLDLSASLRHGNRLGALSTRRPGGVAALPKRGRTPFP